ncbi:MULTISPECIES: carbohydrate kinase [Glaesserella]|uniref:Carbohydrate kinase n=1 Tax=Glaesserella australis TaxID=2094024 RepID=A0A328BY81_9PAST|nr:MULTISPECIES: carbohydrate kinase [Glaesserella]AUI66455.1 carbohydrate kinase [Glaesserella sp. 15-184]RAL18407.1 carbohydrate kinase [Glaesserella australis]
MNNNEKIILELIRQNPFISQQDLADYIGLSRSAVANIISSLIKREYLLGKAYVLNERNAILCIGAANVDKKIKTYHELKRYTSNPVNSITTIGGVARNVAENLGRLGQRVNFISTVGNDPEWERIKSFSSEFMDMNNVITVEGQSTGCYTALLDKDGEMYLGLADMSIYDNLTPKALNRYATLIKSARCIVADLNCPKSTIEYLCKSAKGHGIPLILIAVSEPKMDRLPQDLQGVSCLIINKGEVAAYFNQVLDSDAKVEDAVTRLMAQGVEQVVLTSGSKAILNASKDGLTWHSVRQIEPSQIVDVTGAGDAFSGAFIYAWLNAYEQDKAVLAGLTNAYHTIQSEFTVRPNLTQSQLETEMEHYYE